MKNIIIEELHKLLNENYDNRAKYSFTHNLYDISQLTFLNYQSFSSEFDTDIIYGNITINWDIYINLKEWGIKSFDIEVTELNGVFMLNLLDKQTDEIIQENEKNINDFNWKFIYETSTLSFDDSIYIKELEFDFKSQICRVKF